MHEEPGKKAIMRSFSRPHLFLFGLGLLTLATQAVVTRELLGGFGGSELLLSFFYAAWLAGLGAGAYFGRTSGQRSRRIVPLSLILIFGVPLSVAATRFMAVLPGAPPGVLLPWWSFSLPVMGIIFPLAFVAGMLFPIATSFLGFHESPSRPYGMSYMIEAAGSLCSGAILSFWLLDRANPFMVLLPFIGLFTTGLLLLMHGAGYYAGLRIRFIIALSLIHAVAWPSLHNALEAYVWNQRIGDIPLVWSGPSKYGYYQVADRDGAVAFYMDGIPVAGCEPDPIDDVRTRVFRLATGEQPHIVISGNMRHAAAIASSDHTASIIEHDKMFMNLWKSWCDRWFADVIHDDIRLWLSKAVDPIDLLVVDAPEPTTARANRYYTKEFFTSVRERLSPDGAFILSGHLPASHIRGAGIEMGRIVFRTLRSVFPSVLVSPGPGGWFFASRDSNFTKDLLFRKAAASDSTGIRRAGLAMMFPLHATEDFEQALADTSGPLNTDSHPRAYTMQLRVALARMGIPAHLLSRLIPLLLIVMLICLTLLAIGVSRVKSPARRTGAIIGHTGFVSFATSFLLLIAFQHAVGTLYSRIALLTGLYMAGLSAGAYIGSRHAVPLHVIDGLLAGILGIMAFVIPQTASHMCYYVFAFLFAFIVGLQFPSGVNTLMSSGKTGSFSAGYLDSADHIGAGIGALTAGIVLLPALGFQWAFALLGVSKLITGCLKTTTDGNLDPGGTI